MTCVPRVVSPWGVGERSKAARISIGKALSPSPICGGRSSPEVQVPLRRDRWLYLAAQVLEMEPGRRNVWHPCQTLRFWKVGKAVSRAYRVDRTMGYPDRQFFKDSAATDRTGFLSAGLWHFLEGINAIRVSARFHWFSQQIAPDHASVSVRNNQI
jgi:hypothetical protein